MKATITTVLLGWWSFPGFFWTIQSIFSNLIGGSFYAKNAYLQGQQAFYFAREGNIGLSGATARGALALVRKAKSELGRPNQTDITENLDSLQRSLESLLDALPKSATIQKLKSTDGFHNRRFIFQMAIVILVSCVFVSGLYSINIEQKREAQAKERNEADRLQQEGIDRAKAEAIAAQKKAELQAMEEPLPQSGVYHSEFGSPKSDWAPFKINNQPDANALFKLVRVDDGMEVMSVFVRAGENVEVHVPLGSYTGKIASGQTWYGDKIRFGPNTNYGQFSSTFDFRIEGDQLAGNEINLIRVTNGNLQQTPIDASQF